MGNQIELILIGAGNRGAEAYGPFALVYPEKIRFVAVAEPDDEKRKRFARQHGIPRDLQFRNWQEIFDQPQMGQAVLICTQDWLHVDPAITAMRKGYDVLLEKPMATTLKDCQVLVQVSEETEKQLHICHVLRYTHHFEKIHEILESGILGRIVNISHRENVSWWHMAHSFVRGNWGNSQKSSPMILAKCCHDLDLLTWFTGQQCETISSKGNLFHYRKENQPSDAPERCLENCPHADSCQYYAPDFYEKMTPMFRSISRHAKPIHRLAIHLNEKAPDLIRAASNISPLLKKLSDHRGWPVNVLVPNIADLSPREATQAIRAALINGPYGRCVYSCDNDVVDSQVVLMQFKDGTPVSLTMHGHSNTEYRTTRIEGTEGSLYSEFGGGGSFVETRDHKSGKVTRFNTTTSVAAGHGGGDFRLMDNFWRAMHGNQLNQGISTARKALESHIMAFAAEDARLTGETVNLKNYR